MKLDTLHEWTRDYRAAVALQRRLAERVEVGGEIVAPAAVAGVDVSYQRRGDRFFAGIVVLSLPGLEPVAEATAEARVDFPYIPGLLSFRELPVVLKAWERLETLPDAVLVDGQGIAHPRRLGIAAHLGLWIDLPTVGCAKSRLCGEHAEPDPERGSRAPLVDGGERLGTVLRTRDRVRPLFVSPGHRIGFTAAEELTLACCTRYRLPEPTRLAHLLTNRVRREAGA